MSAQMQIGAGFLAQSSDGGEAVPERVGSGGRTKEEVEEVGVASVGMGK